VALALLGIAFVVAASDIAKTPTCKAVNAGEEEPLDGECFDGSTARRAGQAILSGAAGAVAILALIPGLAYAFTRRWIVAWGVLAALAVLLAVLYALLGRVG
jgi:hypothetical protein